LLITITGCKTTKVEKEIILPPKPQREEMEAPKDLKEVAELLNYYEHKLQEWEAWAKSVDAILTDIEK
jgi:hypothetical protein